MSRARWVVLAVWLPGVLVALGAAAATAHGLFEVALGSGVPAGIAWIYPLITDGLAIVAYVATAQLTAGGRRYAWTVVILAAGLSGIAQATYLAGGVVGAEQGAVGGAAPSGSLLRFGVGAWPAIAAAIVAHLLFMLAADHRTDRTDETADGSGSAVEALSATAERVASSTPAVHPDRVQPPAVHPPSVQSGLVQPGPLDPSARSVVDGRTAEPTDSIHSEQSPLPAASEAKSERPTVSPPSPKRGLRARRPAGTSRRTAASRPSTNS
ncbi:DUF2637 domain-containing protein [Amycolatopsis sp. H20-H5]|uniref:DUF2637 domain-containing protein n=1 Tax=Amycolatopsis sp. H20-H5 TaxID=3046309 RepID=UPI002DBDB1E2|nr:DUF2637 domain-containing protein [Amycolatopsis sp. H20-H5]MEC3974570.1 DUF2637 domain-containing protein [Amycolatopsis sp. H20-H5]